MESRNELRVGSGCGLGGFRVGPLESEPRIGRGWGWGCFPGRWEDAEHRAASALELPEAPSYQQRSFPLVLG